MAEIFKAKLYGIAGFEKTLVVKQILPEYAADSEFVKMFIDEANIAVSLTHGNIVPVYELGKIGERYYIAMEFVDGENLETIIDQCRKAKREIPVHAAVEITIEICKGLDYAHKKQGEDGRSLGIVHRDVSPQNVMVSFDGEVKIVDFGIAKAASKLSLTRVGTLKGKFGYMSPEQAVGSDVDWRTDIYAAGIVCYEALTGTKLFDAENDLDLLKRVRAGAVLPPRMVSPRIPESLDRIVMKALTRDPNERYQHASQFQMDLQRWLYSRQPGPEEEPLSTWMRGLFRRDPARPVSAGRIPSPEVSEGMMLPDRPRLLDEARSRRDVSFAQNDEIVRALEEATNEARRVMSGGSGGAPRWDPDDRPTARGQAPIVYADSTSSGESSGELTNLSPDASEMTRSTTASVSESETFVSEGPGEVIEWDETTDNVIVRRGEKKPEQYVERATIEGPTIRIPRGRPGSSPPWAQQGGAAPEPSLDLEQTRWADPASSPSMQTAPAGQRPSRQTSGRPKSGAIPVASGAVPDAPLSTSSEPPLFPTEMRRRSRLRPLFTVLVFLGLVSGLAVWGAPRLGYDLVAIVGARLAVPGPTATEIVDETPTAIPEATPTAATGATGTASPPPATTAVAVIPTATPPITPMPTPTAVVLESASATPRRKPTPVVAVVKAQYGTISVQADPWGEVRIDGVKVKNTPLYRHRVKAGPHKVVVSNPAFPDKPETREIVVRPNVDEDAIVVKFE